MKPSIPSGTRDFSPSAMVKRNFIFSTIKKVFETFGYQPIETPAMENLSTLEGKYGEEGDKLLFRILNSGNVLENMPRENPEITISSLTEKGLRYDLTVPFARYVVTHRHEITFPFKRYQIQPVWRADRPQKGRYREFYQCDADVIGSNSLFNEVELIQMTDEIFSKLGISITIKINNRKILTGVAEIVGEKEKMMDITIAMDKSDKTGIDGVNKELREKGVSDAAIEKLQPLILFKGNSEEKIAFLKNLLSNSETGKKGIEELEFLLTMYAQFSPPKTDSFQCSNLNLDISLARGLNYYTGTIIEVKARDAQIGSLCGGGRYDDLTGIFGLPGVSGVGISFGLDRIYDVMEELKIYKIPKVSELTKILFTHFGEIERNFCIPLAAKLRHENIPAEIYPDTVKIKKQLDYANKKQIPFVIVVGDEEMKAGKLTLKNMSTGEQKKLTIEEISREANVRTSDIQN